MKKDNLISKTGIKVICCGLLIILALHYVVHSPRDLFSYIYDFIYQLGFALIGIGLVAIIIQANDWTIYFRERLKEIVTQRSYLNTLSNDELKLLLVDTLKAKYKDTDIDREDSFLNFFQRKIEEFIGSPYREHITCSVFIREDENRKDCFRVFDNFSYTCRTLSDDIQKDINWLHEKGEFEEVHDISVTFSCHNYKQKTCKEFCKNKDRCKKGKLYFEKPELDQKFSFSNGLYEGYKMTLKDILWTMDRLRVDFTTSYSIKKDHFLTWSTIYPSRVIGITITFPEIYDINCSVFGCHPDEYTKSVDGDMLTFKHEDWFLPRSGISYNFVKK